MIFSKVIMTNEETETFNLKFQHFGKVDHIRLLYQFETIGSRSGWFELKHIKV